MKHSLPWVTPYWRYHPSCARVVHMMVCTWLCTPRCSQFGIHWQIGILAKHEMVCTWLCTPHAHSTPHMIVYMHTSAPSRDLQPARCWHDIIVGSDFEDSISFAIPSDILNQLMTMMLFDNIWILNDRTFHFCFCLVISRHQQRWAILKWKDVRPFVRPSVHQT